MRRRDYLLVVGAAASGLAGCAGSPSREPAAPSPTPGTERFDPTPTPTPLQESIGSVDLPVPSNELFAALPRDNIPAIIDPAFDSDWTDLSVPDNSLYDGGPLLPDYAPIIGVEHGDAARAYPLRILNWHEVVNDTFGGPLLVSYCPLCGSGVVADRLVNGTETRFGVSGMLWREDLVMYDSLTESLWSQILGAAIRGPRAGEELSLRPSSLTSWGAWQASHPDTTVLLPPPRSNTVRGPGATFDYFSPKYSYAPEEQLIGYDDEPTDDRLRPRTLVIGVTSDGEAVAYPFAVVKEHDVINHRVGTRPVVVTMAPSGVPVAYSRRVQGSTLRFESSGPTHLAADGSQWERATGRAVDGPYEGQRLESATSVPAMFWKGWSNFHPDTKIYE